MIRNNMNSAYEAAAMRMVIQPLVEEDLALFDGYNAIPHTYSRNFLNRLDKLFQKNRLLKSRTGTAKWYTRFAVCFALILVIALTACVAITPMRESIAEVIISWYSEYISIHFEGSDSYPIPKKPTYIPDGFEQYWVTGTADYNDYYIEYYRKKGGLRLNFTRYIMGLDGNSYDNEHHSIENITINGINGILLRGKEGHPHILTWSDEGYVYEILGYVDENEIIKMAESIQ